MCKLIIFNEAISKRTVIVVVTVHIVWGAAQQWHTAWLCQRFLPMIGIASIPRFKSNNQAIVFRMAFPVVSTWPSLVYLVTGRLPTNQVKRLGGRLSCLNQPRHCYHRWTHNITLGHRIRQTCQDQAGIDQEATSGPTVPRRKPVAVRVGEQPSSFEAVVERDEGGRTMLPQLTALGHCTEQ